jgi:hypothetical protein
MNGSVASGFSRKIGVSIEIRHRYFRLKAEATGNR